MSKVIEVELDTPGNSNVLFPPLTRNVRGRFLLSRVAEPQAGAKRDEYGDEIPGQRLALDLDTHEGFLIEPLHFDQFRVLKLKIEAKRFGLEEPVQRFALSGESQPSGQDVPTWLFWLKRLVDAGCARVVKGESYLPAKLPAGAKTNFFAPPEELSGTAAAVKDLKALADRQAEQLTRQSEQIDRLLTALAGQAAERSATAPGTKAAK